MQEKKNQLKKKKKELPWSYFSLEKADFLSDGTISLSVLYAKK